MNSLFKLLLLTLLFLMPGLNNSANAQLRYQDLTETEGVTIQYRWARSNFFDRNSDLELRLKIKNNNNYPVTVSYEIDFFMGPVVKETSELSTLCINPKLAKTGRINGMYYQSAILSNEELRSDDFSWEIRDLEITEVENCRE